ncbi:hypothetical protein GCM10009552_15280 [Rothia nasimurium]|uniref:Uncharacterized protein n=2 Tax=Luteibacter anthropi TaxID=564369 RepID=A0A7X5UB76_9GAMM|nr:hypothetical protein [Luteibacter anthropi]NII07195.1 hypothetical protein [Luteibacter anthropi]
MGDTLATIDPARPPLKLGRAFLEGIKTLRNDLGNVRCAAPPTDENDPVAELHAPVHDAR